MSTRLNVFLAFACALILANLYYTQTIIAEIGASLKLDDSARGIIVTLAQLGYVTGILFLVPLGDKVENKKLIVVLVFFLSLVLLVCGSATAKGVFLPGIYLMGICVSAVQVIIPFGASLASPDKLGRAVGLIASGAILGIVMSRPVSSFLTGMFSWRICFFMSSALMFVVALVFIRVLPTKLTANSSQPYSGILKSLGHLFLHTPGLKKRAFPMALVFSGFALFWASAPLALQDTLSLSQKNIAVLALISLASPICTMIAGRLADRGLGFITAAAGITSAGAAFIFTPLFGLSAGLFVLSALFLDCGTNSSGLELIRK